MQNFTNFEAQPAYFLSVVGATDFLISMAARCSRAAMSTRVTESELMEGQELALVLRRRGGGEISASESEKGSQQ